MLPPVTSYNLGIRLTSVDFPQPVLPIIAVVLPGSALNVISSSTFALAPGYMKLT